MSKENLSQEFRLKNIDETKNYFVEEIEQNELMCKKHKKVCTTLNYIEHSYFSFCSYWMYFNFCFRFFDIPVGITSSAKGLKICAITAGIKKYKSLIKEKKKKNDEIVLLAKTKSFMRSKY